MYPSSTDQLNYETDEAIYFFTAPFLPFDNFSAHSITIWGKQFATAEHAFQWKKFETTNSVLAQQILDAGSPWQVKQLSSVGSGRRTDWAEVKVDVMTEIIRCKVQQHQDVHDMLAASGLKKIIENSPVDSFWGIGSDWKGENWMGKILMQVRDEIFDRG